MSAMIYYTEEIYLFMYTYLILTIIVCIGVSMAILEWCIKKIKEWKDADSKYVDDNKR